MRQRQTMKKLTPIFERDNVYPFPFYFIDQSLTGDVKKEFGVNIPAMLVEFRDHKVKTYADYQAISDAGRHFADQILSNYKFVDQIEKKLNELGKDLLNFLEKKLNDLDKKSDQELSDILVQYTKKLRAMRTWGWIPPLVDGFTEAFLSDELLAKLKKEITNEPPQKISEYFSTLTTSNELSEIATEELARLKISDEPKAIKEHAKKFGWLTYGYSGPAMSAQDVLKNLAEDLNQDKQQKIRRLENWSKAVAAAKQELVKKLELSHKLAQKLDAMSRLMYLKDNRKGVYQKSYVMIDELLGEIAKRLNVDLVALKYLTVEEMTKALASKKLPPDLNERMRSCVVFTTEGKTTIHTTDAAEKLRSQYVDGNETLIADRTQLKGQVAYSGRASGRAKIILTRGDMVKFEAGDILISQATNPELISAMKQAAAIVTDTGGITSHAAIVSRELKIPCVVGTKIATKIFKDGDRVEVDAVNGIVRKI